MNKSNINGHADKRKVNPEWFTDKTWMKVLSEKIKSKDQDIYHVHFENGSRTKLHFHNGNQVLMAVKGKGSLELFKKFGSKKTEFKIKIIERISLNEGDIVHIPAKTFHTHGSINKNKEFFFAKILEVNKKGIIKIQKEDKTIMTYNFQEIQMIIE